MKTLKVTLSISFILLLLLNFTSCKKDKTDSAPTMITPSDLLACNIVVGLVDANQKKIQLRLFTFAKDGNEVKATLDGITSIRAQTVKLTDNSFSFDVNGNGRTVYTLTFTKGKTGKVEVSAFKYYSLDNPTYQITNAIINKVTEVPSIKNKVFKTQDGVVFKFNTDTWLISGSPNTGSFYEVSPGSWKGTFEGKDYMGVSTYEENQVVLYLQADDNIVMAFPY